MSFVFFYIYILQFVFFLFNFLATLITRLTFERDQFRFWASATRPIRLRFLNDWQWNNLLPQSRFQFELECVRLSEPTSSYRTSSSSNEIKLLSNNRWNIRKNNYCKTYKRKIKLLLFFFCFFYCFLFVMWVSCYLLTEVRFEHELARFEHSNLTVWLQFESDCLRIIFWVSTGN